MSKHAKVENEKKQLAKVNFVDMCIEKKFDINMAVFFNSKDDGFEHRD